MKKKLTVKIPKGYLFSAVEAAVKKPGRKDVALIVSECEAVMAGMFTMNTVKAAPVKLDMRRIRTGRGQAIVVNSGNANACTGERGMRDAKEMAVLTGRALRMKSSAVYVCSTGVIGTPLPMERVGSAIPGLAAALGQGTFQDVAAAIMTTDTFPKLFSKTVRIGSKDVTIAGVCKGAGMISPHMATMLCFIITDALIDHGSLDASLRSAVATSFHRITIDGDMSTNDTVLVMANGMAGNAPIMTGSRSYRIFASALSDVASTLAAMVARDGEGATKLVEIEVRNAFSKAEAERGAFAVANSLLVKTAIYGNDANWGRIMAALGYSGIRMREDRTDISLNGLRIVSRGLGTGRDADANERLRAKEVKIVVDLRIGKGSAKVLTCDMTEDYVKINAEYRT